MRSYLVRYIAVKACAGLRAGSNIFLFLFRSSICTLSGRCKSVRGHSSGFPNDEKVNGRYGSSEDSARKARNIS